MIDTILVRATPSLTAQIAILRKQSTSSTVAIACPTVTINYLTTIYMTYEHSTARVLLTSDTTTYTCKVQVMIEALHAHH